MKKNYGFRLIIALFLFGLMFFQSCDDNNPIEVQGNIEGVITDAETAESLNGVNVTIVSNSSTTFAEQSKLTGSDGKFSFKDLEAGNYKLTFSKSGYEDGGKNISLAAGQTSSSDISLNPIKPVLGVSATNLDFGQSESILPVEIRNTGKGELTWSIAENLNWVSVNPTSGKTTTEVSSVSVSVDRNLITGNRQTGSIVINSNGGSAVVNLSVGKAGPLMNVTPSTLDFGEVEVEKSLNVSNTGIGSLTFEATASQSWITLDDAKGSAATDIKNINVKVNKGGLTPGGYNGNVIINSNSNSVTVPVTMTVVQSSAPQVLNGQTSNITYTAAQVSGIIITLGSSAVTQHGHCWSTSSNPTTANNKTTLGGTSVANSFTSNLTGLSANTTYYVRAYATNSVGTAYSDTITFKTPATPVMPTVQTISTSKVEHNSIDATGNLTALGDGLVTDYGFCYSASAAMPTISNSSKVSKGQTTQTGQYTATLTNLQASTKYYIRAYATNSIGTAYGAVVEATTSNGPPIVTNGLVAYYTFDDSNCNEAQDKTGYNEVKQGNGNPVYSTDTPGKSGKSLQLDNDASFQISKSPYNGITAEYTSSVWIKTMTNRTTIFYHQIYYSPGIQIRDNYIYNISLSTSEPYFSTSFDTRINELLLDGNWHLLTITYKTPVFKLYIDGTSYSQVSGGSLNVVTEPMRLGYGFTGKMDNFRIYNRELTQAEITELYNAKQ